MSAIPSPAELPPGSDGQPRTEQQQVKVVFQPAGRQGWVDAGISLLDAARQLGVEIESICGGRQTCGKCQVRIEDGNFARYGIESTAAHVTGESEREARYRQQKGLMPGCRLSCAALVQGDVVVTVPEESRAHKQVVRKAARVRALEINPAVRLCYVELPVASLEDERSDWDRLRQELAARFGLEAASLCIDLPALADLQTLLRDRQARVDARVRGLTATLWQDQEVIRLQPGYHERIYGVAVDVGTTTMVVHLSELRSGQVLATESCMNPQISYGEDLMSRVSYIMEHEHGLDTLHAAVIEALNGLIELATAAAGLQREDVVDLVVVGNTIMHHIFLGIDPSELGGAPFALAVKEPVDLKARDLALRVAGGAYIHVPPLEAGHVGADNVAAIMAEEPHRRDDITLLIDVGTNGEIVLGNRQRLLSASSPTGPAFEGAQIRHGMRAAPGAIERVRIDPQTLEVSYQLIGGEGWVRSGEGNEGVGSREVGSREVAEGDDEMVTAEELSAAELRRRRQDVRREDRPRAAGICGSGIIEAVAELVKVGLLDSTGRFVQEAPTSRLRWEGSKGLFVLVWPDETSTGQEIVIHADDVRAIQLAKAALYAGAKLLMRHYGLVQVDRIVLAGAFGTYIDPEHAMVLGLIPDCDLERVTAVGNAAGDGALLLLLDRDKRREAARVARWVQHVQTATDPHFEEEFVAAIHIPHMRDQFPHLAPLLQSVEAQRLPSLAAQQPAANSNRNSGLSRAARRARRQQRQRPSAETTVAT